MTWLPVRWKHQLVWTTWLPVHWKHYSFEQLGRSFAGNTTKSFVRWKHQLIHSLNIQSNQSNRLDPIQEKIGVRAVYVIGSFEKIFYLLACLYSPNVIAVELSVIALNLLADKTNKVLFWTAVREPKQWRMFYLSFCFVVVLLRVKLGTPSLFSRNFLVVLHTHHKIVLF